MATAARASRDRHSHPGVEVADLEEGPSSTNAPLPSNPVQGSWLRAYSGRGRIDTIHAWISGVVIFLFFAGLVPISFLAMLLFSLLCLATCLRAAAMGRESLALLQGEPGGGAGGRRRPRRNAFLLMGGGVPLDLLNLRLSLIERDFNASDYDMLMALDQVAGGLHRPKPMSDAQLASLPVRVHSSPAKGCGSGSGSGGDGGRPILEAAGPVAPARTESRLLGLLPGVLRSKGSKGSPGTTAAAAKAAPVEEDDGPVCSVCLHAFADGTKVMDLPCRHAFCAVCIEPWLRLKGEGATCPTCKAAVFAKE